MEEQKAVGHTSNSANNNTNNHGRSHSDNNFNQKASSSVSSQRADDSGGEESGWWDCSLCTYRNSTDKFKCEICDLRRGTSTRKPRCNADTSVDLVMKQQEQIRQQTIVKTPKSRVAGCASGDSIPRIRCKTRLFAGDDSKPRSTKIETQDGTQDYDEGDENQNELPDGRLNGDESTSESVPSPKPKKKRTTAKRAQPKSKRKINNEVDTNQHDTTDSDGTSENTDYFYQNNSPELHRSESNSSIATSHYSSSSATRSSSPDSPEPTTSAHTNKPTENSFKLAPLEVEGNLIKYSPPTSSGRTGLIIDKKRFTQHSVTVNDVTITFTEFATRQNKYIRKKKKQRDISRPKNGNGNGKSRTSKEDAKSTNNPITATAVKDS